MKALFTIVFFALTLNAQAGIINATSDLFWQRDKENNGKTTTQIYKGSLKNYKEFVEADVNDESIAKMSVIDADKPRVLSMQDAEAVLEAANINPVVSLYSAKKNYDPTEKGIGFCFGRATFVNLYLALSGFNRANIKKAFIIGPMSKGAWGWHVTTIVESRDAENKEIWLAIDPVAGKIMEVVEWYEHWRTTASDDKKLRLFIAEAGKFGPGSYSKYDETAISDPFYNSYFVDMFKWFNSTKFEKTKKLSF